MGYFNINSILYNFRKIFKYLTISLAFISFIIILLFLFSRDAHAEILHNYPPIPSAVANYNYIVIIYRADSGRYSLWASNTRPYVDMSLHDNTWGYTGALVFTSTVKYCYYTPAIDDNWTTVNTLNSLNLFGIENTTDPSIVPTFIYSNFDILYKNSSNIFFPATPVFDEPYIALPNNSTDTYINGEFSQFMVVTNDDIEDLIFVLEANPDDKPVTNYLYLNLNESSPYYLNNYTPPDGGKVYLISKYDLPGGYTNFTPFRAWISYRVSNNVYLSDEIDWTTNFSAKAIENDRIARESGLADSLSSINGILRNDDFTSSTLINGMPNSNQYIVPTDAGLGLLFNSLYSAFTSSDTQPVRFYIPFTNEHYIEIPADIVSSHLPSTIVFLIQAFYWYLICRFIVKDIARISQKIKSGEFLDESTGNIKTDLL